MMKYKNAKANLANLKALGASVLHGVDATKMWILPHLQGRKFHRIVYNFPHAGFYGKEDNPDLIRMHRDLVRGFLMNATTMLCLNGEIHVNHKISPPFDTWRIEDLASECSLLFIRQDIFRIEDYPGYKNKRGSGSRSDEAFPLGECRTFMFMLCSVAGKMVKMRSGKLDLMQKTSHKFQIPVGMQEQPSLVPRLTYTDVHLPSRQTLQANNRNECHWIFGRYLNHVEETFGSTSYDVGRSVREALKLGFETYMDAAPSRHSSGYLGVLEELRLLSISRSARLGQMLLQLDQQH